MVGRADRRRGLAVLPVYETQEGGAAVLDVAENFTRGTFSLYHCTTQYVTEIIVLLLIILVLQVVQRVANHACKRGRAL